MQPSEEEVTFDNIDSFHSLTVPWQARPFVELRMPSSNSRQKQVRDDRGSLRKRLRAGGISAGSDRVGSSQL